MRVYLKAKPTDRQRVYLMVDDRWFCPLSLTQVAKLGLKAGEIEDSTILADLLITSLTEQFYHTALRRLARRPHSTKELADKLARYRRLQYDRQTAGLILSPDELQAAIIQARQTALRQLAAKNYLNDHEFAVWWLTERINQKNPKGLRAIQIELRQKGIASATITEVSCQLDPAAETRQAKVFVRKLLANSAKLKAMAKPNQKYYLKRRLYARGFSAATISQAIEQELSLIDD